MTQRERDGWVAIALAVATFALYARTMAFDYVNVDDAFYVPGNEMVERGLTWSGVRYAFTSFSEGNYLPLTWLSHMATVELWGVGAGPHHAVNAVIHALNAALVYVFLRIATGAMGPSAVVAALFALHPLRVESVAWVAERKDVLSGTFWMLALIAYWSYARRPSIWRYVVVIVLFAMGLLSKSMVVTLPFVLMLLDVWPLGRARLSDAGRLGELAIEKLPLLALSAAASVVALIGQDAVGAVNQVESWSISQRVTASLSAYGSYLVATFWPLNLAVFYPMSLAGVDARGVIGGGVSVVLLTMAAVALWRSRPYFATGWLWFLGTLVPVIGLVQVGAQSHADRYTYLPHIGLLIGLVWGVNDAMSRRARWAQLRGPIAAAACAACALLTWRQIGFWRNSETLFAHALDVTEDNWFAEGNYAVALMNRGAFDDAEPHLRSAIAIGPARHGDYVNLGYMLSSTGRLPEAAAALEMAVELNPEQAMPWKLLGSARLGMGDAAGAIAAYERRLALEPTDANTRTNLGVAYGMTGDIEAARGHFERVLVRWPDHADALYNYGAMEAQRGDEVRARNLFGRLVAGHPARADGWYALAALDALGGRTEGSAEKLRRAIAVDAAYEDAWKADPAFDALRRAGLQP